MHEGVPFWAVYRTTRVRRGLNGTLQFLQSSPSGLLSRALIQEEMGVQATPAQKGWDSNGKATIK